MKMVNSIPRASQNTPAENMLQISIVTTNPVYNVGIAAQNTELMRLSLATIITMLLPYVSRELDTDKFKAIQIP
jgi:hypothetical protein